MPRSIRYGVYPSPCSLGCEAPHLSERLVRGGTPDDGRDPGRRRRAGWGHGTWDGRLKAADELHQMCGDKGLDGSVETIGHCRSGERSLHTWIMLKSLLGPDSVRNYGGRWTECRSGIGVSIADRSN